MTISEMEVWGELAREAKAERGRWELDSFPATGKNMQEIQWELDRTFSVWGVSVLLRHMKSKLSVTIEKIPGWASRQEVNDIALYTIMKLRGRRVAGPPAGSVAALLDRRRSLAGGGA